MAECMEKLAKKAAEKLKLGTLQSKPVEKEKVGESELGSEMPPEDPNGYSLLN